MTDNKPNLYECASLFAETMNDKFPNGCPDGSAMILIATDGKRLSSLVEGSEKAVAELVANIAYRDKELREVFSFGLDEGLRHCLMDKYFSDGN